MAADCYKAGVQQVRSAAPYAAKTTSKMFVKGQPAVTGFIRLILRALKDLSEGL